MNFTFSASAFLVGIAGTALLIIAAILLMRAYYRAQAATNLAADAGPGSQLKARNKYPGVDVFRHRGSYFCGGLATALLICVFAFGWTQEEVEFQIPASAKDELDMFDEVRRTFTEVEPEKLPEAPKALIEPIPDEEAPVEQVFEDQAVEDDFQTLPPTALASAATPSQPVPETPPPPPATDAEEIFVIVEQMPMFPGCENDGLRKDELKICAEQRMLEYIYGHLKYPRFAVENGIEGKAIVSFVVERDGSITGVKVLRDPGAGIGEEAGRVVGGFPRWIPGKQRGNAVRVAFTLPVVFKLER